MMLDGISGTYDSTCMGVQAHCAELEAALKVYRRYQREIDNAALKYNLPREVLLAVIMRESRGKNVIGDAGHGRGLMQIDDRSHQDWLKTHKNGLDAASNIDYGASLIRENLDAFDGNYIQALAAYNAGPSQVRAALRSNLNPDTVTSGRNYASSVFEHAAELHSAFAVTPPY